MFSGGAVLAPALAACFRLMVEAWVLAVSEFRNKIDRSLNGGAKCRPFGKLVPEFLER